MAAGIVLRQPICAQRSICLAALGARAAGEAFSISANGSTRER